MKNLDWMDEAACVSHPDPDIFFAGIDARGKHAAALAEQAAAVCRACPVAAQCLEHKQYTGATQGVWAGGVHRTKALGRSPGGRGPAPHGSDRRYRQHLRDGDKPCRACWAAHSAKQAPHGRSKYTGVTN